MKLLLFFFILNLYYAFVEMQEEEQIPGGENSNMDIERGHIQDKYEKSEYSHVVGIVVYFITNTEFFNDLHTCIGSVVSPRVVVTAARCIYLPNIDAKPEFIDLHFGAYTFINYTNTFDEGQVIRLYNPEYWNVHPDYDSVHHVHDIAVITTPTDIIYDENTNNCSMDFRPIDDLPKLHNFKFMKSYGWNVNPPQAQSTIYMKKTKPLRSIKMYLENCKLAEQYYHYPKLWAGSPEGKQYAYCVRDKIFHFPVFWRGSALIYNIAYKSNFISSQFTGFMTDYIFNSDIDKNIIIVTSLQSYEAFIMNIYNEAEKAKYGAANLPTSSAYLLPISILITIAFSFL